MQCWVNKEFLSPLKIALLCSLVLDLRALDVWLNVKGPKSISVKRQTNISANFRHVVQTHKIVITHYYQYARPNDKLPSVKRASVFAGQTGNVRAENTFAALILIGCRDVKQLRSANEIVLFKCEDCFYICLQPALQIYTFLSLSQLLLVYGTFNPHGINERFSFS